MPDLYKEKFKQNSWYINLYQSYDIIKLKKAYKKDRKNKGVISAIENVYRNVDNYMNEYRKFEKPKITCEKGCAFCCSKEVFISDDEAKGIYNYVTKNKLKIDLNKATLQAVSKQNLPLIHRECIFLDTESKECKVYNLRPLSCRMLLASSEPKFCQDNKKGNPFYFLLPKMENIKTAVWNSSISGVLPAMILKQVQEERMTK
ncbi:YkgJ family cysteine cluster protein [Aquimarina hainanensis]|uniref:YkgJ family cysteine cluster protein n=2 Tax=Aquimarina hainanensis TaxID=1578017 RepID=A0ABW5NDP1_9FLAO